MTTAIPLTLQLAIFIGLYELAAGIAGLTGRIAWPAMIREFERSPGVTFLSGAIAFIVGSTLILVHSHWTDLTAILVSTVGYIAAAKGLSIMLLPGPMLRMSEALVRHQKLMSLVAIGFGVLLLVLGLAGRADPTYR